MLIVWAISLGTGSVAELRTSPFQLMLLRAAKFSTAVSLIYGGIGLLTGKRWGLRTGLASLGMLFYCAVFSIGVFGQAGNIPAAGFFGVTAFLTAVFVRIYS